MKAKTYVVERQIAWARRHGIELIDNPRSRRSLGEYRGQEYRTAYTTSLNANLFEPLNALACSDFGAGAGGELEEKMSALYSSAALASNLFHLLCRVESNEVLTQVFGLPARAIGISRFEQQRPIMASPRENGFQKNPHLDVVIEYGSAGPIRETAIECKFIEPYRDAAKGLKSRYFETARLWDQLPSCLELARRIGSEENDRVHHHLHAAQLLKHILGMIHKNGKGFDLVYLWYDVPGPEGAVHHQEILAFAEAVRRDGIGFRAITCQDVVLNLLAHRSLHPELADYLSDRYL